MAINDIINKIKMDVACVKFFKDATEGSCGAAIMCWTSWKKK